MSNIPSSSILQSLEQSEITSYSQFSSLCIFFFDYVLTFDDEVNFFWSHKFGLGTVLFFLNRYYVLLAAMMNMGAITSYSYIKSPGTDSLCIRYFWWLAWGAFFGRLIGITILAMRVYAIYNLSKKILSLLVASALAAFSASGWIIWRALSLLTAEGNTLIRLPNSFLCDAQSLGVNIKLGWVPELLVNAFLCGLVIRQVLSMNIIRVDNLRINHGKIGLIMLLMRDSVVYFIVICIAYLTCAIFMASAGPHLVGLPFLFSLILPSCLCSRMLINIRESHYKKTHEYSSTFFIQSTLSSTTLP